MTEVIPIFFLFTGIERDSRDELPVKKSIVMLFRGEMSKRISGRLR